MNSTKLMRRENSCFVFIIFHLIEKKKKEGEKGGVE